MSGEAKTSPGRGARPSGAKCSNQGSSQAASRPAARSDSLSPEKSRKPRSQLSATVGETGKPYSA